MRWGRWRTALSGWSGSRTDPRWCGGGWGIDLKGRRVTAPETVSSTDERCTCMTVIALLSVAPVTEGSMAGEVAKAVAALDDFDVSYETNPMGTVIETDDMDELLAAVGAAHRAVEANRVSTFLKIDDKRNRDQRAREKVEAVEQELGRQAKRER